MHSIYVQTQQMQQELRPPLVLNGQSPKDLDEISGPKPNNIN
jgi:hypothetical protein